MKILKKSKAYGAFEYTVIIALVIIILILLFLMIKNKAKTLTWLNSALGKAGIATESNPSNPPEEVYDESLKVFFSKKFICENSTDGTFFETENLTDCYDVGWPSDNLGNKSLMTDELSTLYENSLELYRGSSLIREENINGKDTIIIKEAALKSTHPKSNTIKEFFEKGIFYEEPNFAESFLMQTSLGENEKGETLKYVPNNFNESALMEGTPLTSLYTFIYTKPIKSVFIEEHNYYENTLYLRFKEVGRENIYSKEYQIIINTDFKISLDGEICKVPISVKIPEGVLINKIIPEYGSFNGDAQDLLGIMILGNDQNVYYSEEPGLLTNLDFSKVDFPEKIIDIIPENTWDEVSHESFTNFYFLSINGNLYKYEYATGFDENFDATKIYKVNTDSMGILNKIYKFKTNGSDNVFLINNIGDVFAKGSNIYGELGVGEVNVEVTNFEKIQFPAGIKISEISGGFLNTLFLTTDKNVFVAGNGVNSGIKVENILPENIGLKGSEKMIKRPQKIETVSNIKQIKNLPYNSFLLNESNELFAFGENERKLGVGSDENFIDEPQKTNMGSSSFKDIQELGGNDGNVLLEGESFYTSGSFTDSNTFVKVSDDEKVKEIMVGYEIYSITENNNVFKTTSNWGEISKEKVPLNFCEPIGDIKFIQNFPETFLLIKSPSNKYSVINIDTAAGGI